MQISDDSNKCEMMADHHIMYTDVLDPVWTKTILYSVHCTVVLGRVLGDARARGQIPPRITL